MTELSVKMRELLGMYGYSSVYNALESEMKETYKFLHELNGSEKKKWIVETPPGAAAEMLEVPVESEAEVSGVRKAEVSGERKETEAEVSGNRKESEVEETSIRVQNTESSNEISSSIGGSEDQKIFFSNGSGNKKKGVMRAIMKKKATEPVVESAVSVVKSEVETNNYIDKPKFDKQEHNTTIEKKYAELKGKGINPESLLSKENLEKWLNEGMSYMRISREKVGLGDKIVSEYAKKYNLKSTITKLKEQKKNSS
jgi:hypothetical protein